MNTKTRTRRIAKNFGIALVAGGLVLAGSTSAQAAPMKVEVVGGPWIWLADSARNTCVQSGSWVRTETGGQIRTVIFPSDSHSEIKCVDGGRQCVSVVPATPRTGWWRFDAATCRWTNMVSEPV